MRRPIPSRRIVALIAAYIVALQALLLPLSVAAGASLAGGLCAASAERAPVPADNDKSCPCAAGCGMQCGAQAFLEPPPVDVTVVRTTTDAAAPGEALHPVPRASTRNPQIPRAPPAV